MPKRSAAIITLATLLATLTLAAPAAAHEERKVGPFTISIGLTGEPVVAGEQTEYELEITQAGKPVTFTDAELEGLALHMFAGTGKGVMGQPQPTPDGKPVSLALHATPWEGPGLYKSEPIIFPSPGAHTAHLHSQIKGVAGATVTKPLRGQVVNEVFPMAEGKYGPVEDAKAIMFPVAVPSAADLAAKDTAIVAAQATQAEEADQTSSLLLGVGAVAALALIVGVLALVRGRSRTRVPDSPAELTQASHRG